MWDPTEKHAMNVLMFTCHRIPLLFLLFFIIVCRIVWLIVTELWKVTDTSKRLQI